MTMYNGVNLFVSKVFHFIFEVSIVKINSPVFLYLFFAIQDSQNAEGQGFHFAFTRIDEELRSQKADPAAQLTDKSL